MPKGLALDPKLRGSICANCGSWREEHYNTDGSWNDELKCPEYLGTTPNSDELRGRAAALKRYYGESEA